MPRLSSCRRNEWPGRDPIAFFTARLIVVDFCPSCSNHLPCTWRSRLGFQQPPTNPPHTVCWCWDSPHRLAAFEQDLYRLRTPNGIDVAPIGLKVFSCARNHSNDRSMQQKVEHLPLCSQRSHPSWARAELWFWPAVLGPSFFQPPHQEAYKQLTWSLLLAASEWPCRSPLLPGRAWGNSRVYTLFEV